MNLQLKSRGFWKALENPLNADAIPGSRKLDSGKDIRRFRFMSFLKGGMGLTISLMMASSHAATDLADMPIPVALNVANVKPNIMFALDNSGSMLWQSTTGTDATGQYGKNKRNFYSSTYNKLYYNPNVTYVPGVNSDGTSFGNSAITAATNDGYLGGGVTNITQTCFATASLPLPTGTSDSSGNCQNPSGGSYTIQLARYAFYYVYSGSGEISDEDNYTTRVNIVPTTATYPGRPNRIDCVSAPTCTYDEEIQNFANWWSYYRSRILTMKTAMGHAFSAVDENTRVGFYTINNDSGHANTSGANFLNVSDFTPANKATWYSTLYAIKPNGGTPLQEAVRRVGEYYKTGVLPGAGSSVDPIQHSCQANYLILSTDGYWNGGLSGAVGNTDRTVPTLPEAVANDPVSGGALTPGENWPRPFYEENTATSNTLADVAMKYWATDLRTTGSLSTNNVNTNSGDSATWQHMTAYTIGLGADGTLPSSNPVTTLAEIKSGTKNWPAPVANDKTTIDDLWHAAVNGHGVYLSASDPGSIQSGLTKILNDIANRKGTFSAVAVNNPNVSASDNVIFNTNYNPANWSGEISAYALDVSTGAIGTESLWNPGAQEKLDGRTGAGSDTRLIATFNGSSGIPFQWSGLTAAQQTKLSDTKIVEFLRGWRGNEGTLYRKRAHVLGDIVNAGGVVVSAANYHYTDTGYTSFVSSVAGRSKTLYQGANDGMLHAFDASVGQANSGSELWAYVPNLLMGTLKNLSDKVGFTHKYYVDGTPVVADVDFKNTQGGSGPTNWRTILVGGLGKGGKGYYALDVTTPVAANEAAVASKVLWEFTDVDMGFSYGKPVIVKTRAADWVVLLTSGYNNVPEASGGPAGSTTGDGKGHLYVLNARTGALIEKIDLPDSGSVANPSGFAQIAGLVQDTDLDNTVELVYGGDLNGDVWRIDLSGATTASWSVSKFAILENASGQPQPVTAVPETACFGDCSLPKNRMVYVGTGQYLGISDVTTSQTQSMYGLVDSGILASKNGNVAAPASTIEVRDGSVAQQTMTVSGSTRTASHNGVDLIEGNGWYIDLPISKERANTNPQLAFGVLIFTTNVPDDSPCSIYGGSSWINFLDYKTGGSVKNGTNTWALAGKSLGMALASGVAVLVTNGDDGQMGNDGQNGSNGGNGKIRVIGTQSDVTVINEVPPLPTSSKRVSWREIVSQ